MATINHNNSRQALRTERLEARVTHEHKRLFQQAASLSGMSLTDFVVNAAQSMATNILERQAIMELSARDCKVFVNALLNPPAPTKRLQTAAERYKLRMTSGESS